MRPRNPPAQFIHIPPFPPPLQALARYAFGMGTLQMVICTLAFTVLGLPPGESLFSQVCVLVCVLV